MLVYLHLQLLILYMKKKIYNKPTIDLITVNHEESIANGSMMSYNTITMPVENDQILLNGRQFSNYVGTEWWTSNEVIFK